jgi:anti-sigma B factor antagonist
MREKPPLPESTPECLPYWTAVTGGSAGLLARGIYSDGHLVVTALDGELDLATAPSLAYQLDPLAAAGRHLILDLAALRFCDCIGLNLFLRLQRQAAAAGGALHVLAPPPRFRQLVALTGTRGLLPAGARPCRRQCCVQSHLGLRPAGRERSQRRGPG